MVATHNYIVYGICFCSVYSQAIPLTDFDYLGNKPAPIKFR